MTAANGSPIFPSKSCLIPILYDRLIPFTWVKNMDWAKFDLKA